MANFVWPLTGGGSSSGSVQFLRDSVLTQVTEDTITPANNIPLPVKLTSVTGDVNITAGDLNVQLSDVGPNADVTKIGDGTNRLEITSSSEAKVNDASANTELAAINTKLAGNLKTILTDGVDDASIVQVSTAITSSDKGLVTNAVLHGLSSSGGGTYVDVKVDPSGKLLVDASGTTVPVSGPLTDAQLRASAVPVSVSNFPATQAVSGSVSVTNFPASQPVTGTFWQTTQPVSAASLPLPTGAATETTLAAASAKLPATLGQKTMANSLAVAIASDQGTLPVSQGGKSKIAIARNDYTSTNVTTGAYVQLIASTSGITNMVEVFDSSGETLVLAVGGSGSEVDQFYINPGGNGQIPLTIPSGSRVSIKAITATASVGYINLNLYS